MASMPTPPSKTPSPQHHCRSRPYRVEQIQDPYGAPIAKPGAVRDGGSFIERFTNISCWNTVMDENQYMIQRWNEFKSA
jgi:hypothetical protein